jgi:hypothetical protein
MKKIIFLVSFFTLFFVSCEKEFYEPNSNQHISSEVYIKNGRLVFQNKASFNTIFGKFKDATNEELSNYFLSLYQNGFYSLQTCRY